MARSAREPTATHTLALLLCAATIISAGAAEVVTSYSIPAFNATTADDFVALSDSSFLTSISLLFDHDASNPEFNRSEGFLLLPRTVAFWRAGAGGAPDLEGSFNTSFTLVANAAPVSFVVLRDVFPPFNVRGGLRGAANYDMSLGGPVPTDATGSLAFVEVDAVRSYGPDVPTVGLNVTVTSRGAAPGGRAVWIEYDAAVHRLSVYVAGAREPRPTNALVYMPLGVEWRWTTKTAFVGFFSGAIRDIIVGVRNWDLTVDRFPVDRKKGTSWWVLLLALLGSVVAAAAIVTVVVCYFQTRRRRQLNLDPET